MLALACLAARFARAQPVDPGFEPIPAASISEGTLRVPEENFSIKAPSIEWEWLRDRPAADTPARSYLCRHLRTGERFLLKVFEPSPGSAEQLAAGILEEIRASREAKGGQLVDARNEPSDFPVPGSRRLSAMILSGGAPLYFTAYAVAANRFYVFPRYSDSAKESPVFHAFVRSFALTAPVTPLVRNPFAGSGPALLAYASIVLVSFGLGSVVNLLARRPVVSGGLVAFVLILVVALVKVAGELAGKADAEKMGVYVGEALVPAAVGAWLHGRYTNRKRAVRRGGG